MKTIEQRKREFAEKWGIGKHQLDHPGSTSANIVFVPDPEFLSDLDSLIRDVLIDFTEILKKENPYKEYSEHINKSLASAQKGVANTLMFALSVKDDENGNLIIDKESRK